MEKKMYMTPAVEVLATEAEELLAGSINLGDEGGTGTLGEGEVNGPGLSREVEMFFDDEE
jgi:hypothetical protein